MALSDLRKTCLLGLGLYGLTCAAEIVPVRDYDVYKINAPYTIEPSGLTIHDGALYTVCDDANSIFEIKLDQLSEKEVKATEYMRFDPMQLSAMNLDLEGITRYGNEWVLVSEAHHKMIRVGEAGLSWLPGYGSMYPGAAEAGLFAVHNAGLESVTHLEGKRFLLSVEREPRGVIEVEFDEELNRIVSQTNQVFTDSDHPLNSHRHPDLTGLFYHDGSIYALHRNAYVIFELIKDENGQYQEGRSWGYEHIVKHPEHVYADMSYGHAEGLAVDDDFFYLVLDNNKKPSHQQPNDFRSLLIRIKRD